MEIISLTTIFWVCALILIAAFLFWRYIWFFRNPPRTIPQGENIVSPADGTVVYVKSVKPKEDIVVIKQRLAVRIEDIVREHLDTPKIVVGIFMSPFNVHYNRSPLGGMVEKIVHHPPKTANFHMGPMHFRTMFNRPPLHENSMHIVENERTVTRIRGRFKGADVYCYVVQIAGKSVSGIESYISEGVEVGKGEIFGMIRIGSQVDTIVPHFTDMQIKVRPGDKVRAGESVLVE
jgi:phosphatidylserine decarboxylase